MNEFQEKQVVRKNKALFRRYKISTVVILLLISVALLFAARTQKSKPDPTSENFIRGRAKDWLNNKTLLNKEPNDLNEEDFAKITNISIGAYTWDIRLLEKFKNLRELRLNNIRYPDEAIPKWQKFLSKYSIYNFEERFELDLTPIQRLSYLEKLCLSGPSCKDIKPATKLSKLKYLSLSQTQISNYAPLKEMTNLITLELYDINISNLKPLMNLENLQRLYIRNCNNISDQQVQELQKALPSLMILIE